MAVRIAFLNGIALLVSLLLFTSAFGAEPLKIGVLFDLTGEGREVGRALLRVSKAAVDVVNARGGVAGRRIALTSFDTRGDPILGRQGARELVSFRNVRALIGPADWATAMMTKPFLEGARVPTMMLTWEDSVIRGGKFGMYEWIFQLPWTRVMALEKMGRFLADKGWYRVGLVTESDALGRAARAWFEGEGRDSGLELVGVESFTSEAEIRAKVLGLVDRDPQAVVSWCGLSYAPTVATVLHEERPALPLFQSHEISPQRYIEIAGPAAEESLMVSNKMLIWAELDGRDPQKRIIGEFLDQYGTIYGGAADPPIGPLSASVWDSVMILVRSMREGGTDRAKLRDAIERIQRHVGLGGVYGFTRLDHNGLDPDSLVIIRVDVVRREGGRWVGSWTPAN